ncbi:MAG: signal recognition particle receptor subunit alpha, partial [Candidatus Bipolaricaulia bacterium]
MTWFERLRSGLEKTRSRLLGGLEGVLRGRREIDRELLDEIEALLIGGDLGVAATEAVIAALQERVAAERIKEPELLLPLLKEILKEQLAGAEGALALREDGEPTVFLILG